MLVPKTLDELTFWLETLFLFTKSDFKTIFFPVVSRLGYDTKFTE